MINRHYWFNIIFIGIIISLVIFVSILSSVAGGIERNTIQFELTELERMQMNSLNLSEVEMRDYLVLRNAYQGLLNVNDLSVYELLGILENDPAKRLDFARRAAKLKLFLMGRAKSFETLYLTEIEKLGRLKQSVSPNSQDD